jgi:hypothetical protein
MMIQELGEKKKVPLVTFTHSPELSRHALVSFVVKGSPRSFLFLLYPSLGLAFLQTLQVQALGPRQLRLSPAPSHLGYRCWVAMSWGMCWGDQGCPARSQGTSATFTFEHSLTRYYFSDGRWRDRRGRQCS